MLSRRTALALGGTLSTVGLAGCAAREYRAADRTEGRWPMARGDARNRATAPEATPPTSTPSLDWQRSFQAADSPDQLLVTADTVFAVRPLGVSALDRATGVTRWETDGRGQTPADGIGRFACLAGEGLYTADGTAVRAFDTGGELAWETEIPGPGSPARAYGLVAGAQTLLLGLHGRLAAFGRDGTLQYSITLPGSGDVFPGIGDGRLYAAGPGRLVGGDAPGILDRVLDQGPSLSVRVESAGRPTWPLFAGDRLLVGDRSFRSGHSGPFQVRAYEADGTLDWSVDVAGPTSHLAVSADGSLAFVVETGSETEGRISALDVESGERVWTRTDLPLSDLGGSVAVGGESLLVGGFSAKSSDPVRAFGVEAGELLWETEVSGMVTDLVPVGNRVFVATSLGHVVVLA